jgi:hypothetical protein
LFANSIKKWLLRWFFPDFINNSPTLPVIVEDTLISLKSNSQHTEAVMTIENLLTKDIHGESYMRQIKNIFGAIVSLILYVGWMFILISVSFIFFTEEAVINRLVA